MVDNVGACYQLLSKMTYVVLKMKSFNCVRTLLVLKIGCVLYANLGIS